MLALHFWDCEIEQHANTPILERLADNKVCAQLKSLANRGSAIDHENHHWSLICAVASYPAENFYPAFHIIAINYKTIHMAAR
jgi:hypothetical protein